MDILKDLAEAVKATGGQTTKPYDTPATVIRVEGDIVWVHIPGGVDETPVRHTIAAKPGDVVQIRVSGGSACIVGNETAPPTDDTKAEQAIKKAEEAGGTATKFVTDTKDGIFVHPKNNKDDGVRITDAIEIIKGGLSFFRAWIADGLGKVRVGRADEGHTDIDSNGMRVYGGDGTKQLANIGCTIATLPDGTTVQNPNFTFGERTGDVGAYSTAIGWKNVVARGDTSFAIGDDVLASGAVSHAGGIGVTNRSWGGFAHGIGLEARSSVDAQAVLGKYNDPTKTKGDYGLAFMVGNGTDEDNRSNAFDVYENGDMNVKGKITAYDQPLIVYEQQIAYVSFEAGTVGTRAATVSLGSTSRTGYAFLGAYILDHQNTVKFSVNLDRDDTHGTLNVVAYRATAGAVTDAPVRVRMIWAKTNITEYVNNS